MPRYTKEQLAPLVAQSQSYAQLARLLGKLPTGSNTTNLRNRCKAFGIDVSHMTGQLHAKGKPSHKRRPITDLLIEREQDASRIKGYDLTKALLAIDRPYCCVECALSNSWNGKPIRLQVDHIDGRYWNNKPDNLRFLCPNCHSQTETWGGKNKRPGGGMADTQS